MENDSPPRLTPNLLLNFEIKIPQRKSRSEMGLLNTNQVGRRLSAWQGHTGMLEHGGHPTVCRLEV